MSSKDLIVQRYLDKPLLLDGFKFDLRVYVCVFNLNPVQAFLCDEGLARFCTVKYQKPTKANYKKNFMHLTNYSINKHSDAYVNSGGADEVLLDSKSTKRTLSSIYETLAKQGIDVEAIKSNIADTCSKTMQMYGPMIEHQIMKMTAEGTLKGKPFNICGFDLLIDEDLNAWVLEVNNNPSLLIHFDADQMSGKKMEESDVCQVDLYVKSQVVRDTILLAQKSVTSLNKTDRLNSMARIAPSEDDDEVYQNIQLLRRIFYSIAPTNRRGAISSQNFEKLYSKGFIKKRMAAKGFMKMDMGLMFTKFAGNGRMLDLLGFCNLMAKFYTEKVLSYEPSISFTEFIAGLE